MAQFAEIEALEVAVAADPDGAQFAVLAEAYRRVGRPDDARRVAVAGLAVRPDDTAGRLALGLTLLDLGEPAAARYELERAMSTVTHHPSLAILPSRDSDVTFDGDIVSVSPNEARSAFNAVPMSGSSIGDDELEAAFADAESVPEEMLDANCIAVQAMLESELDEPEGFALEEAEAFEPGDDAFQLEEAPAFATETMARLLAGQGDLRGASAIRERISQGRAGTGAPMDAANVPLDGPIELEDDADSFSRSTATTMPRAFAIGGDSCAIDTDEAHTEHGRILATLETWLSNLGRSRA